MERIRGMMGVCPQFDVLWGELSGIEHLQIYGSIKGVDRKVLNDSSWNLLERVKLTYAAKQRTSAYSGGMKRRLSVALALLGDPKIVRGFLSTRCNPSAHLVSVYLDLVSGLP